MMYFIYFSLISLISGVRIHLILYLLYYDKKTNYLNNELLLVSFLLQILENNWWSETKHGLLGKEIQQFDYVYIAGYPCLDARFQQIPEEVTAEFIERARLTIFAMSVMCISQETYNEKLSMWINTIIRQRYK